MTTLSNDDLYGNGTGKFKCKRGNTYSLDCESVRVSLKWAIEAGEKTDLDTSCVAIDEHGNILMDETVYFGALVNSNKSVCHSGDVLEGGKTEVIDCNLRNISKAVRALYFIVTVATPDKTLGNVKGASVTVMDTTSKILLCQFVPGLGEEHTAMFLMRVTKNRDDWTLTVIGDMDHTARDFGSLIPEIKGYSRDICPNVEVNPRERIAVMRKGGAIRVKDYSNGASFDEDLVFGLAWDITNGKNIDLDASVICLDENLDVVDIISYQKLCSDCGSIRHAGDELKGEKEGDDEQIFINLNGIQSNVMYVTFVVNSYSGEDLNDISSAKSHLFNPLTGVDLAQYQISNNSSLDDSEMGNLSVTELKQLLSELGVDFRDCLEKRDLIDRLRNSKFAPNNDLENSNTKNTGLLMTCLYRSSDEWHLRVIGKVVVGIVAAKLVNDLQKYLRNELTPLPAIVPEPEIIVNAMPESCFVPTENTPFVPVSSHISVASSVPVSFVP